MIVLSCNGFELMVASMCWGFEATPVVTGSAHPDLGRVGPIVFFSREGRGRRSSGAEFPGDFVPRSFVGEKNTQPHTPLRLALPIVCHPLVISPPLSSCRFSVSHTHWISLASPPGTCLFVHVTLQVVSTLLFHNSIHNNNSYSLFLHHYNLTTATCP
jgi:hypothetical protein